MVAADGGLTVAGGSRFGSRYSEEQRAAAIAAYDSLTAKEVVDLAASGTLPRANGGDGTLKAFELKADTVRSWTRDDRKRRSGEQRSKLVDETARTAVERLRQRLINVADAELVRLESQKDGARDLEKIRQAARVVREIAALPGPEDPRPPAPGQKVDGVRNGGETRGGMAGDLVAAHRRDNGGAPVEPWPTPPPTEHPVVEPEPAPEPDGPAAASLVRDLAAQHGLDLNGDALSNGPAEQTG